MKIKWKIVLSSTIIILLLTLSIVSFSFVEMKNLAKEECNQELKNYSNMGMKLIDRAYPGNWIRTDGKLYKGETLINENYEVIDEFTNGTDVIATIFIDDTRISTNALDKNENRQINSKASEKIIKEVLEEGKEFSGTADINGISAQSYYVPIKDANGNVIGMWFVGVYTNVVNKNIFNAMIFIIVLAGIVMLIGIVIAFVLSNNITKGINLVKERLKLFEEGNFSFEINNSLLKRKDEVGDIANSSQNVQLKISEIIKGIQNESTKVKETADNSAISVEDVHNSIEDISATTEELSAGLEETSAATQEMNASASEIEDKISNMKQKTVKGENLSCEIKGRAEKLKEETELSYNSTTEIYNKTNKQLRDSIEQTKAIEEIKNYHKQFFKLLLRQIYSH